MKAVTSTVEDESVAVGDGYNINTGLISLTTSTASGVLYIKNNESKNLIIKTVVPFVGSAGTTTESTIMTVIKNPTTGTLISGASAVDMNENRDFGSPNSLTVDAYKGAEGNTVTDGTDVAIVGFTGRAAVPLGIRVRKGNSIAFTLDTNTSSGTTIAYLAAICYLEESI
jgi:hypothetical protein